MADLSPIQEFQAIRQILSEMNQEQYAGKNIEIGDFSYGKPVVRIEDEWTKLIMGKFCSIGPNVTIMLGGEHRVDWNTTYPFNVLMQYSFSYIAGHPFSKGDVQIGNDVWIGADSKIMSGVTIADGCIIGANALVTKSVLEPYTIVGGVPAKIIKRRFSETVTRRLCEMQWWNWSDEDIVAAIPLLQSSNIDGLWNYYKEHVNQNR
ncbi:MAG: CatB-related O-acetyltransferase [Bacteroidales bacterium]|nr:CatB-related O-acetyltransferase [Lachnoclostridium sp.]MCM1383962.1 CatB-related O-acetyltransferase [Lachnoclostridium sp.]MCM1464671.1 CatB-related O-acetyltransferase [Bacteroidales bacterium]